MLHSQTKQLSFTAEKKPTPLMTYLHAYRQQLLKTSESVPVNFHDDWKLVFDFFIRNTKFANPPKVGGVLEDAVLQNAADLQKLSSDIAQRNLNASNAPPSLAGILSGN
jgi:hypothetical protein